jgi:hypothetical protein
LPTPEVLGQGFACPGEEMTSGLPPISEGGPGVRGQRPRVLSHFGNASGRGHEGDIGRLKVVEPARMAGHSRAAAIGGRDGGQPVTGSSRGSARAAARRAPQV